MQQEEGFSGEEWQDIGRVLLQSLCQLLAPLHQPLGALRPGNWLCGPWGPWLLSLRLTHHHHRFHIHPLQEGEPKCKPLDKFPVLKHRAVHLEDTHG